MQHAAGLQYGQGAVNSHQSPTFADITQTGGNTTSSLRQFRKKEGPEKNPNTDLNDTHIARVPPHNHYPARPNDYYRYPQQYSDYTTAPYKESPAQVKYSEIAETPLQNVDHLSKHKDLMDMCNLQQMPASRQQNYASNPALQYHPESQYNQYKYAQCRKYPPQENDFLAKLQRINPTMARSIMSDHHIRESQTTYPHHYQNQRYYPAHNPAYNYQYNYPSCNYRTNQMPVGGAQYNDRSLSPRNLMMNYSNSQKISPNYGQYNPPEYAQHYQHRRVATNQDYYQQCRPAPYNMPNHQETNENRSGSGGLRHFIENWAEEEAPSEITPIFKENVRLHSNDTNNEQVFVINSSDFPPCLENVSLVPTENGQYIIKTGALDNSIVRIKETENNGERTVNLQIVEKNEESGDKTTAETTVPYQENQTKDCDQTDQGDDKPKTSESKDEESIETSVIVANEASLIKDMPLIDEETPTEESNNLLEENHVTTTTKRTQRIFSVDDIIGTSPTQTRRNSLQFPPKGGEEDNVEKEDEEEEEENEEVELRDAISVEDNSVILEIGGALVQLNMNQVNGTKILSVLALSESLVIDVNGNYQEGVEEEIEDLQCQNEVVIGEENEENEVTLEENLKKSLREEQEFKKTGEETKAGDEEELKKREQTDEGMKNNDEILKKCDEDELKKPESIDETKKTEAEAVEKLKKLDEELKKGESIDEKKKIEVEKSKKRNEELKKAELIDEKKKIEVEKPKKRDEEESNKAESIDDKKKIEVEKLKKRDEELKKAELIDEKKKIEVEKLKKRDEDEPKKAESINEKKKIDVEKLKKRERKSCDVEEDVKKGESVDENEKTKVEAVEKSKKREKKSKCEEEELKKTEPMRDETCEKLKKREKRSICEEEELKKREKKLTEEKEESHERRKRDDEIKQKKKRDNHERKKRDKKLSSEESEEKMKKVAGEEEVKKKRERSLSEEVKKPNVEMAKEEEVVLKKHGKKAVIESDDSENEENGKKLNETKDKKIDDDLIREEIFEECARLTEEISKKSEEIRELEKPVTKAAKKLYIDDSSLKKPKLSKLEETVNKIKSLKEKTANKEEKKTSKKVTFNLDNEEMDRKKLSWEEYNNRKRKAPTNEPKNKIMENTVTSSDDINDETVKKVVESIENAMKPKSPPKNNNWEEDTPSPPTPTITTTNRKLIIDVNEFNIKPIENVSTPSPVSSSQFSYHSEEDSLQVYKDVVDSKLNSLNIKIPKFSKPKPVDKFTVLERFLNKASLNLSELEEVKKFIELKRKIIEEKVVKKVRKKKRFRNLYAEDSSDDSDSSRSEEGVGDYSVYQRDSQGVPKLIFKRKSGLPQPFVKLERSQAVEMMAKKRKLY